MTMQLSSPAFEDGGTIPAKYTCDGDRKLSPPLIMSGVPEGAKSLVLTVEDPDIPQVVKDARNSDVFDHWLLYDIPSDTVEIAEGTMIGTAGLNSRGEEGYTGPCPPPDYEPSEHRYIFTLYALDQLLALPAGATKREVLEALAAHVLEKATLVGRYSRK